MPFYLAHYIGSGTLKDPFRPAGDPQKRIDLRRDCTKAEGYAVCWHPTALQDERCMLIGKDPDEPASPQARQVLQQALALRSLDFALQAVTLRDLIGALLDPLNREHFPWNPVTPSLRTGMAEVYLGPLVWRQQRAIPKGT